MRERLSRRVVVSFVLVIDLLILAVGVWRAASRPTQDERLRQALRREVTAEGRHEEATLNKDPGRIQEVVATPRSWRC